MLKTPWVSIIPFYDDRMAAIHLFKSLKEHNCPAIWCDGRFKEFQQINGSDLSTDGLRELIHRLAKNYSDSPKFFKLDIGEKGKQGIWKDYDGPKEKFFFRPDLIE